MESSIGQRLKMFLDFMNLSQTDAAVRLNYPKQNISSWIKGKTNMTTAFLPVLLGEFQNLNARWLITGEGSMLMEANETPYVTTELKRNSNEPQPPYHTECKNPLCKLRIESLEREIELLEANISDLRRKENCGQGELKGGVEKPGRTG